MANETDGTAPPFELCGDVTELTDAEILGMLRRFTCEAGFVREGSFWLMRTKAVCGLSRDHSSEHASFQLSGHDDGGWSGWFRWDEQERRIDLKGDMDCGWWAPGTGPGSDEYTPGQCMLFKGHPGAHFPDTYLPDIDGPLGINPSWLGHTCHACT